MNSDQTVSPHPKATPSLEQILSCTTLVPDECEISSESILKSSASIPTSIDLQTDSSSSIDSNKRKFGDMDSTSPLENSFQYSKSRTGGEYRQGISRYAPYGTRFAANMRDGQLKTSHIAGDLANRARQKNGRGCRVDLVLVTHEGELFQLETALAFYENQIKRNLPKPGPSEVLNHLKEMKCDFDYRKGDGVFLLQRNASNFFKRMMEHARRINHPIVSEFVNCTPTHKPVVEPEVNQAATILGSLRKKVKKQIEVVENDIEEVDEQELWESIEQDLEKDEKMEIELQEQIKRDEAQEELDAQREVDWSRPKWQKGSFYTELLKNMVVARKEQVEYFSKAAETFDWSSVVEPEPSPEPEAQVDQTDDSMDIDMEDSQDEQIYTRKKPQQKVYKKQPVKKETPVNNSTVIENPQPVLRKGREGLTQGLRIKGLSRHSPYGTRFCAQMPGGEMKESFLAGDLADRVRSPDGKTQGELILVLHLGEIKQLEVAWEYVKSHEPYVLGAGAVLDHLRSVGLDINHRKSGSKLLQKNAGNFFKRVQEFGKRRQLDSSYLTM
ncbi:hypothetical protein HDV04_000042 [Boothiomyces sp. JEL0838]|nr:hypothetical protein HDV04_000042 [Boothiomyces sp. JEL0838]